MTKSDWSKEMCVSARGSPPFENPHKLRWAASVYLWHMPPWLHAPLVPSRGRQWDRTGRVSALRLRGRLGGGRWHQRGVGPGDPEEPAEWPQVTGSHGGCGGCVVKTECEEAGHKHTGAWQRRGGTARMMRSIFTETLFALLTRCENAAGTLTLSSLLTVNVLLSLPADALLPAALSVCERSRHHTGRLPAQHGGGSVRQSHPGQPEGALLWHPGGACSTWVRLEGQLSLGSALVFWCPKAAF